MSTTRQDVVLLDRTRAAKEEMLFLAIRGAAEGDDLTLAAGRRFADLAGELALADAAWSARLTGWLAAREALGSAAIVTAVERVRAGLLAGLDASGGNRRLISGVLRRPEDPGKLLGYWFRRYGPPVPKPIKRGVADAVRVLYDESAVAAHERPGTAFGFADVLKIAHARPEAGVQSELFRHILASRRGPAHGSPVSLPRLHARAALNRLSRDERRDVMRRTDAADVLAQAAMTADMIPGWLGEPLDAPAWAGVLPLMGYRDLLRTLPDLEEAGVDDRTAGEIAAILADGDRVARAGVRPLEILAADRAAPSRRWSRHLERAADAAVEAVPGPPGRTLVLVDRSASMFAPVNDDAAVTAADQAAVFGAALALRARHADLVQFGAAHARVPFEPGDGLTAVTGRFGEMGDGDAATAVRNCFDRHDRIVIVTSGSPGPEWGREGPAGRVPSYFWNVGGRGRPAEQVGRYVFRGLTDGAFDAISFLESARNCHL